MNKSMECAACGRTIDADSKLCPFCSGDPRTGVLDDSRRRMVQETFSRKEAPASIAERFGDLLRHRQGVTIVGIILVILLAAGIVHSVISARNQTDVGDVPAVPLTEVADLNREQDEEEIELPDLEFHFDGDPETMETFLIEPGAEAPLEDPSEEPEESANRGPSDVD